MQRREAMGILASAGAADLATAFERFDHSPEHRVLRGPETGLVMVRGRVGGGGGQFNVGEVTVTRASVRLDSGAVGHAYCLGTDGEKVVRAALVDAMWQEDATRQRIERDVLEPLRAIQDEADRRLREETAATQVDFFTMVRGEDA
jgi:alpha-D-ribose 1-methylphosphonate 5-triphosphate synthase subunit PhnG